MKDSIYIDVVKGGFILSYRDLKENSDEYVREVFMSSRKLQQKLKEVIEMLSYVPTDSK